MVVKKDPSATVALTTEEVAENKLLALYARLAAPFDTVFQDVRGGVHLTYVTGEQVVTRLNEVLGFTGWTFDVLEHGINAEADEVWVKGELIIYSHLAQPLLLTLVPESDRPRMILVRRQQFGSQKLKRSRSTGAPMDIGFDLKGAGTDCLKKCASLIGVGLYLSKKEGGVQVFNGDDAQGSDNSDKALVCAECDSDIKAKEFANGEFWSAQQVAARGRDVSGGKPLCMKCIRKLTPKEEKVA